MKLEQIYTNCLAHAAYYLESNGEVAIFDPLRETMPYIEKARKNGATIKYVFETHFHADFVSGHLDIAKSTGATVVYGPTANPSFEALIAEDGQVFQLGDIKIKAIHTPGHTLESTVYLVIDEDGNESSLISGDTLLIGDVGRPDLAQHLIKELTEDKLAGMLFHSLRNKIIPLGDDIIVYPNHGAGSACGKLMSKETTDTLGHQKKVNYALDMSLTESEFKHLVLTGLTPPPGYFPSNVLLNIKGCDSYYEVLARSLKPLSLNEFELLYEDKSNLVLDTRNAEDFSKAFIPNSINIGLDGSFAQWVGETIKDIKQPILLVTENGKEEEAITRLSRIGYDGVLGYLNEGFETWQNTNNNTDYIERTDAFTFSKSLNTDLLVIDVRKRSEFEASHIMGSKNIPLNELTVHFSEIPKDKQFVLICAGGYRSMIASSLLNKNGWSNFFDIKDGFAAIEKTDIKVSSFIKATTLL